MSQQGRLFTDTAAGLEPIVRTAPEVADDQAGEVDRERTIDERFREWLELNPEAYALFKRFAFEALAAGKKRYSADALLHRVRWESDVVIRSADGFRANDHYTSRLARKLIAECPQFRDFFELRTIRTE